MVNHFILVHDNGKDTSAVTLHPDRKSARDAFKAIDSGMVTLYELRRSQAVKRANFDIVHRESKNALTKKSEKQLRDEARKRNLSIADNTQATSAEIISEIQQHELTKRLDHRRPLTSDTKAKTEPSKGGSASPQDDVKQPGEAAK